ncbi:BlaI/MecI/CopY family transcriptional regulator [Paenibacillus doosanensis]|uniref:BlaI/MecI/CopY family transcriptional regulator n=1 Tax=Paenibacillus doosanensis TaxID=1229154 RepID=UPI00217FC497|nr:BlaI/MecI/CopY family transcriptional regulator [Paenibacillus doosanensis]MCS7460911.1 BlaI/MecI/CopY family transcriptional regulator [Paenibacillus doosanensis]
MKIHHFKTNESGLNRFFGALEAKIMDILWDGAEKSIKDVQQKLERDQKKLVNFNTVMTVMNRLVEKGVLNKRLEGRSFAYSPVLSKEQFIDTQSKELTHELIEEFGPLVVSHMLDALEEADTELMEKLEQKIKQLKKET